MDESRMHTVQVSYLVKMIEYISELPFVEGKFPLPNLNKI